MRKILFAAISIICIFEAIHVAAQEKHLPQAKKFLTQSNSTLSFEENKGQISGPDASKVRFTVKERNLKIFVLNDGVAYQFEKINYPEGYDLQKMYDLSSTQQEREYQNELTEKIGVETYRMDMQLIGANQNANIVTEEKSTDYINYYNHNTLDVHIYQKLRYKNIYPNIDWILYIRDGKMEYEFEVHPGGDPDKIQMQLKWVEKSNIDASGNLHLENSIGKVTDKAPETFQNGKNIGSAYVLNDKKLSFNIQQYNPNQTLIIDPTLDWATYYGGTDYDRGNFCTTDASGNIYMAGQTSSLNSIASGGYQIAYGGGFDDAFLVKFNASGVRQWATYYGGTGSDKGFACVIGASGDVYLGGNTFSSNNIASGGFQNVHGGFADAFLVKFNASGIRQWATYFGGTLYDNGLSCAIDASDNVYLAGGTQSTGNIASGGFQNTLGGDADAFLVKFNASGIRLWSTYYGGTDSDNGLSCTIDASGNVYLGGETESTSGIASGGYQNIYGGGTYDAFLVKFNTSGARQWATYYGGNDDENERSCTTDALGNVYLAGLTLSTNGIASGGYQNIHGGYIDAFLVKFNASGVRQWGTYYGGTNYDAAFFCTTDAANNVYLTGGTQSPTNIASGGFQNTFGGGTRDVFFAKFNSSGIRQWGSYYGGTNVDIGLASAIDPFGNIYIGGFTNSISGIASGGHQNIYGGGDYDAFLVKFSECADYSFTINQSICEGSSFAGYTSTGTYVDTFTSVQGCDSIRTINLTVKPNSHTELDTTACYSSIFNWNGITVASAGDYYFTGTNSSGCDSLVHLSVIYTSAPIVTDSVLTGCGEVIYSGEVYTQDATFIDTFRNSIHCDSLYRNVTIKVWEVTRDTLHVDLCQGGSYNFNGRNFNTTTRTTDAFTNSNGCDSFLTLDLTVHPLPVVTLKYEPHLKEIYCDGDTVALTGAGAKDYIYYDNLGDTLRRKNPTVTLTANENKYFVMGIDEYGCSGQSEVTIQAEACCNMMIPNAFSPNGDGLNDGFGIETLGHSSNFVLQVFDRWGRRIFISHDPKEKWDGTYNGGMSGMGVYYYIVTANCSNGTPFKRKGDVNLIR